MSKNGTNANGQKLLWQRPSGKFDAGSTVSINGRPVRLETNSRQTRGLLGRAYLEFWMAGLTRFNDKRNLVHLSALVVVIGIACCRRKFGSDSRGEKGVAGAARLINGIPPLSPGLSCRHQVQGPIIEHPDYETIVL